jgi:hypothetical protein
MTSNYCRDPDGNLIEVSPGVMTRPASLGCRGRGSAESLLVDIGAGSTGGHGIRLVAAE